VNGWFRQIARCSLLLLFVALVLSKAADLLAPLLPLLTVVAGVGLVYLVSRRSP
jgi:hypothetical protein